MTEDATHEIVYLGRRPHKNGTMWLVITPEELGKVLADGNGFTDKYPVEMTQNIENKASWFKGEKKRAMQTVGAVYSVKGNVEDGRITSIRFGTATYLRPLKTSDKACQFVEAWRRLDAEEEEKKRLTSLEKNAQSDRWLEEAVKTIKHRYKAIPAMNRQSFKVWLLNELEKK